MLTSHAISLPRGHRKANTEVPWGDFAVLALPLLTVRLVEWSGPQAGDGYGLLQGCVVGAVTAAHTNPSGCSLVLRCSPWGIVGQPGAQHRKGELGWNPKLSGRRRILSQLPPPSEGTTGSFWPSVSVVTSL